MAGKAKIVVTFDDGSTAEFNPNRPRLLLDMEKRYGVQSPERHEHVAWLAWHALVEIKGEKTPLDEWIDTVDEFDTVSLDDEAGDGDSEGKAD